MTKPISLILFCVFPLLALSQEAKQAAPKAADDNAAAEASQANEEVELSEEQKQYNFCVMQNALEVVNLTRVCVNQALADFAAKVATAEQSKGKLTDIAAQCFHSGTQIIEGSLGECKEIAPKAAAAEAENKELPIKAKE